MRRAANRRKALLQCRDHVPRVVHRQRGLRHIGETRGVGGREGFGILDGFNQRHRAGADLAHRADDFRVAFMADEQDVHSVALVPLRLGMNLRYQGAGGVDIGHVAAGRLGGDDLGDAVGGKDHRAVVGAFGELFHEDGAHGFQALHDMGVVDDFMPHEDRGAPLGQGLFDDLDGPVDPRAEAARLSQQDFHLRLLGHRIKQAAPR